MSHIIGLKKQITAHLEQLSLSQLVMLLFHFEHQWGAAPVKALPHSPQGQPPNESESLGYLPPSLG